MAQGSTRLSLPVLTATGDVTLGAGAEVVAARRSDRFTRFDGNLAGLHPPSPAERVTSATRLEGWAACPFAYLLRNVLGVDEVENPEDELQITPRDKGSLVHQALEDFIGEVLSRPSADQPGPSEPWSASDRARMVEICERVSAEYEDRGLTGRPIFWRQDKKRILADLLRFLREDSDARRKDGTRPLAAELAFGLPGADLGTVALDLPDGRSVQFRGKADRVDVATDGTLRVLDYKTGKADDYRGLNEDNPDAQGRRLQLPVYGQAARLFRETPDAPVRAEYWFVSARGRFERVGYSVTPAVLAHVGRNPRDRRERHRGWSLSPSPHRIEHDALGRVPVLRSRRHGSGRAAPSIRAQAGRSGHGHLRETRPPTRGARARGRVRAAARCLSRSPPPRTLCPPIKRRAIGSPRTSTPPCSSKPGRGRARPPPSSGGCWPW